VSKNEKVLRRWTSQELLFGLRCPCWRKNVVEGENGSTDTIMDVNNAFGTQIRQFRQMLVESIIERSVIIIIIITTTK